MTAFYKKPLYRLQQALVGKLLAKPQPKAMLYVGAGAAEKLGSAIGRFGFRRVLVVTDKPLLELGVPTPTLEVLRGAGVATVIYDGVQPDPTEQVVDSGIELYRREGCDAILAFGGGSSIDAAKVIALATANNCAAADCIGAGKCKTPATPLFAVPTTAGTGSEATLVAVISNNETHEKGGVIDASMIPRGAALDPVVMSGLPAHLTAATGMDALTHAIESYISRWGNEDTDYYALAACRLVFDNLRTACSDGGNLEAREAMALASYYGGLAITQALVGYVHAVSHNIGARYGIPHGLGNALALAPVLELLNESAQQKLAQIALHCGFRESSEGDAALARKLIEQVSALNEDIGIPRTTDLIPEGDTEELVDAILAEGGSYAAPRFLTRQECRNLVKAISS